MKRTTIKLSHAPHAGAGKPSERVKVSSNHALKKATVRRAARGKPFSVEHRRRRAVIARHAETMQ